MMIDGKMYRYNELFFSEETSLGDAFVQNGLVHHFANQCRTLYLPSTDVSFESIECLYEDHDNIEVLRTPDYRAAMAYLDPNSFHISKFPLFANSVRFTNGIPEYIVMNWERQTYENFDVPFSVRYSGARIPKKVFGANDLALQLNPTFERYALVSRHMGAENTRLDFHVEQFTGDLKIIEMTPGITTNLLEWISLIEGAEQIHCPPSSVHQLVDSMLDRTCADLYFHHIRRNYMGQVNGPQNGHRWKLIHYEHQV